MEKEEQESGVLLETPQGAEAATVGARLRQLRREKGLSIRDVALETNLSASNLAAIEHEKYQDLPADTFMRGQVAIYARLLGLDGPETARAFLRQRDAQPGGKRKSRFGDPNAAKKLAEPAHLSSASLAGILLLLIVLFIAGFSFYTGWNPFAYFLSRNQQPAAPAAVVPEAVPAVHPPEEGTQPTQTDTGGAAAEQNAPSGN